MSNIEIPRTTLGDSDLEVSQLCFGTYHLGTNIDTASALDLMGRAYDYGINFVDTSDNYSGAEALIGLALRDSVIPRDGLVIATKTGLAGSKYEAQDFEGRGVRQDTSPERIKRKIEGSLRVMGIDTIDLYQLHVHDPAVDPAEIAETMGDLKDEGKIRHWGISNYDDPESITAIVAASIDHRAEVPSTLQNYHNMFKRPNAASIEKAIGLGMTVLAYSPLAKSVISDRYFDDVDAYREAASLPPEAVEALTPEQRKLREVMVRDLPVMEKLLPLETLAHDRGTNLQRLGIAWLMHQPNTIPILGAYKQEHLDDLVQAAAVELDDGDMEFIDNTVASAFA